MTSTGVGTPGEQEAVPRALVQVRDLELHFPVRSGVLSRRSGAVRAVDGVSFDIHAGDTLGLVGESGSGKSTTGRAILQLLRPTSGSVRFDGTELTDAAPRELRGMRRDMQMIFQDPYASLNPRIRVGRAIREPLELHGDPSGMPIDARVEDLLERVGLPRGAARRYPHEFSGGQRQRIGIARAIATNPRFIVADEPISALDVSIQAQVLNLLQDLKRELGLTYLFIAHDLALVRHISDRVAVMYLGRIVELATRSGVFDRPLHPYTRALLASVPAPPSARRGTTGARHDLVVLGGEAPDPAKPPTGCHLHPRCPLKTERCIQEEPVLRNLGADKAHHLVACHHADDHGVHDLQHRPGSAP